MTDKITPKQEMAYGLYQTVISLRRRQSEVALEFGFTLKKIKEEHLYRYMGDGAFDTFWQFCASPEIKLRPEMVMAYIRVYEYYVEKLQMKKEDLLDIPFTRLNQMKAKIENLPIEEQKEWIEKAKTLMRKDFEAEMVDHKFAKPKAIQVTRCKTCKLLEIHFIVDEVCVCGGHGYNIKAIPVEQKGSDK